MNYGFYSFGFGASDLPDGDNAKAIVGGKGAGLCEMSRMGLPVPPGFVISTGACHEYEQASASGRAVLLASLAYKAEELVKGIEAALGRKVLVAVRSGAPVSMPGMMDTILNVGISNSNRDEYAALLGSDAAEDCLNRLRAMYKATVGESAPETRYEQLKGAIEAVLMSWNSVRAKEYRKLHGIPDTMGTAVVIQAMVYGNLNDSSCAGVLFSRDPATGEARVVGEFLPCAQGEEVVAGTHDPLSFQMSMKDWSPAVYAELVQIAGRLEAAYLDMQDIEFTVESGKVYILQTRNGKRSAAAAFKIAHDLAEAGIISRADAVNRVSVSEYEALLRSRVADGFDVAPACVGVPASPGVVSGVAVDSATVPASIKVPSILLALETTPEDFPVMAACVGVATLRGGMTSHAAVVARGMNKAAVVGLGVDAPIKAGDKVTIDGSTGRVWVNVGVPVVGGIPSREAREVLAWGLIQKGKALSVPAVGDSWKEDDWAASLCGAFPEADIRIVIDARSASVTGGRYAYSAMLKALSKCGKGGVLSFNAPARQFSDADVCFLTMIGGLSVMGNTQAGEKLPENTLGAFCAKIIPKGVKKNWEIDLAAGESEATVAALKAAGWRLVSRPDTLRDLLNADGYIKPGDNLMGFAAESFSQLLELVNLKSGKKVRVFPEVVNAGTAAYQVFAK